MRYSIGLFLVRFCGNISKCGIAVSKVQAVCGKFTFYVAVVGEKIACEQALLFGRAKRAASERRSREGPAPAVASPLACLSRVYFSRYPPNGELARRLVKKSLCRGDLLLFRDNRIQILKGLPR